VAFGLAVVLVAVDPVAAYSSLFGSLAVFLPSLLIAALVGSKFGRDSAVFLRAAVLGEAGKLLLTAILCAAVFIWVKPLAAGWFFTGMLAVLIAGWLGLIFSK
jgi:ATP synthase protein I